MGSLTPWNYLKVVARCPHCGKKITIMHAMEMESRPYRKMAVYHIGDYVMDSIDDRKVGGKILCDYCEKRIYYNFSIEDGEIKKFKIIH